MGFDPLSLALAGAVGGFAAGGGESFIGGLIGQEQASEDRRRLRDAGRRAERITQSQIFQTVSDPFNVAAKQFVGGLFGIEDQGGRFGGGVDIGGRTFFTDPGRKGLGKGVVRRGRKLGRQLGLGLEFEKGIRTGRKAQRAAENLPALLEQFESDLGGRTPALTALRRRGFDLADLEVEAGELLPQPEDNQAVSEGGTSGFDDFTLNVQKALNQQLTGSGFAPSLSGQIAAGLGTGLARTQLQAQLLPQLMGFATQSVNLRQQLLPLELQTQLGVLGPQTPPDPLLLALQGGLGGGLAGGFGGAQLGLQAAQG